MADSTLSGMTPERQAKRAARMAERAARLRAEAERAESPLVKFKRVWETTWGEEKPDDR